MKNRKIIISLVGVMIMLLLIISATYAYFSVTITGNGSKTMITANTPKKHSLSVSTLYDDIHIHVDNNDMKLANVGSYYGAVNDNRYEKTKEEGTHKIIEVSSKGMENIRYSCSGDIKVTLNIDNGSMGSVLEREDVLLYLKGLGLDETLDLSTLKINNTKTYNTSFEIDGDSSDYLSAIVELINKSSYQNYIANKILNVKIEAENMVCRENGTYKYMITLHERKRVNDAWKNVSLFYDEEGMYQKIQNIYLVDYIDIKNSIKTWELGDTNRGTKSDEVMGWLEKTLDIEDSYDLYIGSNGSMRAPKDMSYAFQDFTNLKSITGDILDTSEVTDMFNLFYQDSNLIDISSLVNWNISNVNNLAGAFFKNSNLVDISPLTNWNLLNVTSINGMFAYCKNLIDITPLANWNISKVINMDNLFIGCTNLENLSSLQNWNMSNVTNMNYMFQDCINLIDITPLASWDVSSVINMVSLFQGTNIYNIIALSKWDTKRLENLNSIFWKCKNLNDISPLANWDTSNLKNSSGAFMETKVSDLTPITNWKMSKVTNMSHMFRGTLIEDITPLSNWNVSNVVNMECLFLSTNIDDLTPLSRWDVSSVTTMASMFGNTQISDLTPIRDWDVSSVTDIGSNRYVYDGMFANTLISDLSPIANWDVSNVTNTSYMFSGCNNLTKVDLKNWKMPKIINVSHMFNGCSNLIELKLPQAPYSNIISNNYSNIFKSVLPNITVYTESSQMDWVETRLQEALGENNNSQVIAYE